MLLHSEADGAGPVLTLVHGFTQTRRCWGPLPTELARDHKVVRVDAPGHGRSADVMAGLRTGGRLIADEGGESTYLGYSLGARFVLHLGLSNPELVRGLVLISGTAGIEDPAERAQRRRRDTELARSIEADGVLDFLDRWLRQPLFATLPEDRAHRMERMENTVEGLVSSLDQAGAGSQDPTWHRLERLSMPVLVVAGELDSKYVALGRRLAEAVGPNATFATVEGAGHAAHLERPDAFVGLLRPWLAEHGL